MKLKQQCREMNRYLESNEIIDFNRPDGRSLIELADRLDRRSSNQTAFIKNAYEWVRDMISHSADIDGSAVTCKASDVLKEKEGICFAKSHLLAALLRCKGIPAGFCYQKLILDDSAAPYLVLHGLNAVYFEEKAQWIRLDARGNKPGINAQFSTETEELAFPVRTEKGEIDIPIIYAYPDSHVIHSLMSNHTVADLWNNLPTELERLPI